MTFQRTLPVYLDGTRREAFDPIRADLPPIAALECMAPRPEAPLWSGVDLCLLIEPLRFRLTIEQGSLNRFIDFSELCFGSVECD